MENAGSIPEESAIKTSKKGKLTAAFVRTVNRPGVYGDQHGLRLRVYESRNPSWHFFPLTVPDRGMFAA